MFRKIAFVFVLVLIVSLVACGSAAEAPPPTLVEVTPLPPATDPPPTEPSTAEPTATPPSSEELAEKIDTFLKKQAEGGKFSGAALVARGDEIILSQGYGMADREQEIPNTSTTRFRIGSLTKAFTAVAILMLQEQGRLTVDDLICDYLDDCPEIWNQITIHHLLTHTSGIYNYTDLTGIFTPESDPWSHEDIIRQVVDIRLDFAPGSSWRYSNTGYFILGMIIERVSGQSYESYLQENIFDPLGMTDTGIETNPDELATGYTRFSEADNYHMSISFAAGALYSTVEDMFRWVRALQSDELISPATRDLIFTQHAPGEPGADWGYGYGWIYATIHDRRVWEHYGEISGFTSRISLFPDDDVTSIFLQNQEYGSLDVIGDIMTKWILGIE